LRLKKNLRLVVSCDGGAASGKSTGAKLIAKKYKLNFLSSGLLYRYASYLLLKNKPKNKIQFLKKNFKKLKLEKLKNINLHTQKISNHTSEISKVNKLRKVLKTYQVSFSRKYPRCIIEGRDISTKIVPNSDVKFYFKCSLKLASKRRYYELRKKGYKVKLSEVKKSIKIRDMRDKKRKHSPLLKHRDALEIDTGKLGISAMIKKMSKIIERKIKLKYGS
tara:strand:+ start:6818 stop:7477 length:660 start_codon:yes stop_codon:yes gene_type:complete